MVSQCGRNHNPRDTSGIWQLTRECVSELCLHPLSTSAQHGLDAHFGGEGYPGQSQEVHGAAGTSTSDWALMMTRAMCCVLLAWVACTEAEHLPPGQAENAVAVLLSLDAGVGAGKGGGPCDCRVLGEG